MHRFSLALLLLVLAACTGTVTVPPETFLIVGYTENDQGNVGLVRASSLVADRREEQRVILARPLPAPPVAYDIVDRVLNRSALVVLSRVGTSLNGPAFLSFFNTLGLDPDNPEAFIPLRPDVRLDPEEMDRSEALAGVAMNFCPVRVQIAVDETRADRPGRYVAILNDNRGTCGAAVPNSIAIIDLEGEPTIIGYVEGLIGDILATAFYVRQGGENPLYYLTETATGARLHELTMPAFSRREITDIPLRIGQAVRDIGLMLLPTTLLALRNEDILPLPELEPAVPAGLTNARRLIVDELGFVPNVLVVGSEQVAVRLDLADPEPQTFSVPGVVDGTLDTTQFAYFASPEVISVFDVLSYNLQQPPRTASAARYPIEGLGRPTFITWVQALLETPLP